MKQLERTEVTKRDSSPVRDCLQLPSYSLMEAMEAGVWIVSLSGITEYINSSLCRIVGYSPHEMVGRPLFDFIDRENMARVQGNIKKRSDGQSESYTMSMTRKDRTTIHVVVAANPLFDSKGSIIGAMALITEYKTTGYEVTPIKPKLKCANLRLHPESIELSIDEKKEQLSVFLFKLLSYFIQHNDRVISRDELIQNIWKNEVVTDRVIDSQIVILRKKLLNFNGVLKTVYGLGYILKSEETNPTAIAKNKTKLGKGRKK